ncbi:hypothetical protein TRFO_33653 [Tritrichomonas foetus]|uniref:Uncharacterized protein n=1 Tax=Tritrichomonas foetus TaxID=1144522 RepID=A0A1J4JL43_9EUKA|nr:hypothetical protein TRFO_33653 [Tritrichomonas foetus]|eukprot:OHS99824.1 hypothetical protein TRFO_33653 [Tritrichomonas foetus]
MEVKIVYSEKIKLNVHFQKIIIISMSKKAKSLSPEDRQKILDEAPDYIEKCGVNNKERAIFVSMIAHEVVGSQNHWFSSMQPRIVDHSQFDQWNMAYKIVTTYLKENFCDETLKIIDLEFDNPSNPLPHPVDIPDYEGDSTDFENVLEFRPTNEEAKFSYKLNEFLREIGEQGEIDENNDSDDKSEDAPAFLTQPSAITKNSIPNQSNEEIADDFGDEDLDIEFEDTNNNEPNSPSHSDSSIHLDSDNFDIGDD